MSESIDTDTKFELFDQVASLARHDGLYFTTSFWWRLDLLWQCRPFYDRKEPSRLMRWTKVIDFSLCVVGYFLVLRCHQWIAKVTTYQIARDETSSITALKLENIRDVWPAKLNARDPEQKFLFCSAELGLLHYIVYDVLVYLGTKWYCKDLVAQVFLEVVLKHYLSPLHAWFMQGNIIAGGVPIPMHFKLAKNLALPVGLCSAARMISIMSTLWCLRRLTDSRRSFADIHVFEIIGALVVMALPWLLLTLPATLALYLTEISIIPEDIETKVSIVRLGFSTEDSQYPALLCWWSLQLITSKKLKIVAVQMLLDGLVTAFASRVLRRA